MQFYTKVLIHIYVPMGFDPILKNFQSRLYAIEYCLQLIEKSYGLVFFSVCLLFYKTLSESMRKSLRNCFSGMGPEPHYFGK